MIYSQIPLKYKFIPINIDDEHFRITFCVFLLGFLKEAKEKWLEVMDEEDVLDGERLEIAENAKELHKMIEHEQYKIMRMREQEWSIKTLKNYHKNVNLDNCEFQYGDVSPENVKIALDIFVKIAKYYGHSNTYKIKYDEEEEEDNEDIIITVNGSQSLADEIITRDAMEGMRFITMPDGTIGLG